ncbi:MAG: PQQ-binding-like beta-propeller repeat protein [Fuerstiella sp.]
MCRLRSSNSMPCVLFTFAAWLGSLLVPNSSVIAGDWPQILGPNRTGVAVGETLLKAWPAEGPTQVWSKPVGSGFAGVSVVGTTAVVFHRKASEEIVEAVRVADGQTLWASAAPCNYRSGISSDSGPRCVPVIHKSNVITFGAAGNLRCLDFVSGKELWARDVQTDFGAPEGYFGSGSTPLIYKQLVIVNVGSRKSAAVVAFDLNTGKTIWQTFDDTASYSAPIVTTVEGKDVAIVVTRLNALLLDPASGKLLSEFPFGMRGPTVNGATPVMLGDRVLLSSSYRVGSVLASVGDKFSDIQNSGESLLATQYATPIVDGDVVFAVDGRQDSGEATLKCFDPLKEQILWEKRGFDYGTLIRADGQYLFLTCGGELIRFEDSTLRYKEISRHQVLNATRQGYRLPAISNGKLFVRDDGVLKCLQVGK